MAHQVAPNPNLGKISPGLLAEMWGGYLGLVHGTIWQTVWSPLSNPGGDPSWRSLDPDISGKDPYNSIGFVVGQSESMQSHSCFYWLDFKQTVNSELLASADPNKLRNADCGKPINRTDYCSIKKGLFPGSRLTCNAQQVWKWTFVKAQWWWSNARANLVLMNCSASFWCNSTSLMLV